MSDLLLGTNARPDRDGCDCPPWVVRCAHLDDERVILGNDIGDNAYCHSCNPRYEPLGMWYVAMPRGFGPCGCGFIICEPDVEAHWAGTSELDALAAFHEAELQLLRGAVDD